MKLASILFAFILLSFISCKEQPADLNTLLSKAEGPMLVSPKVADGTVLRVIAADSLTFTAVIVQSPNDVLCDTVSAYKSEYVPCKTCLDGCTN